MKNNEIKAWIIEVSHTPSCTSRYGAYAVENPLEKILEMDNELVAEIQEDLWNDYGWTVTGWHEESIEVDYDEDPEAWQDEFDQLREDFFCDIDWSCTEDEYEEIKGLSIIYDERSE